MATFWCLRSALLFDPILFEGWNEQADGVRQQVSPGKTYDTLLGAESSGPFRYPWTSDKVNIRFHQVYRAPLTHFFDSFWGCMKFLLQDTFSNWVGFQRTIKTCSWKCILQKWRKDTELRRQLPKHKCYRSVSKHWLNAYYMPVTVLNIGATTVNKMKTNKHPCPLRLYVAVMLLLFFNYN